MKKAPDPKGERGISWGLSSNGENPSISAREYRRNPHSVTLLNYHFVFCPKRRKKVLTGRIAHRLQEIIFELCTENNWRLIALEIMPDHVHLFLNADPSFAPSVIINISTTLPTTTNCGELFSRLVVEA